MKHQTSLMKELLLGYLGISVKIDLTLITGFGLMDQWMHCGLKT